LNKGITFKIENFNEPQSQREEMTFKSCHHSLGEKEIDDDPKNKKIEIDFDVSHEDKESRS